MGSKAKIASEIIPIMTRDRKPGQYFVDLFCGGCNLLDKVGGNRIGNDANIFLIAMWKALQDGYPFPTVLPKPFYVQWRNYYNSIKRRTPDEIANEDQLKLAFCGWVGFMGSFNGRFYDGGYSGHAVMGKNGKVRNYVGEQINNTLANLPRLQDVNFTAGSYDSVEIPPESIVYCDIPYLNTKQYTTSHGFDYEKFYDFCRTLAKQGHKVFVSEYWMPDDFICIWQKEVTTSLNPTRSHKSVERLYTLPSR